MKRYFYLVLLVGFFLKSNSSFAQKKPISAVSEKATQTLLQSGPMVGYSEMKEVGLWVQTTKATTVKFKYWPKGHKDSANYTKEVKSDEDRAFAVTLIADKVLPSKTYEYAVYLDGLEVSRPYPLQFKSQELWQHRKPVPDFTFAIGSCAYVAETALDRPGKSYGGDYQIFTSIYNQHPDFMLWTGDNIYLREADWNTKTGIYHRNTHTRSLPEMQALLGSTHNYAIWDDHDFGPNDSDRGWVKKKTAEEAFNTFWVNPNTNGTGDGGITGKFQWNDADFFLMDDRYFRAPNDEKNEKKDYFGAKQVQWLLDNLEASNAPFKFIISGGQVLSPVAKYENYATYPDERKYLLAEIEKRKITGVIFISGDRHHTELSKMERVGTFPIYDLTCSPLTSTANTFSADEGNTLRMPDTYVNQRNFGLLKISGTKEERKLTISIFNSDGKLLWEKDIKASELK